MTPQQFIFKWKQANLNERSAAQQHFLDICELLEQPKPAAVDPDGTHYTFERGVHKMDGGDGWADVWMKGHFGWEYKGKHKDLTAAYRQLLQYRNALENPPLLVVCDLDRFEVHTNFTGTAEKVYAFNLDGLAEEANLDVLRRIFTDPDSLKPGLTRETITQVAAERIGQVADSMRQRKVPAEKAAHFLMKLMFCMFAEDIELLPSKMFSRILAASKVDPPRLTKQLHALFQAMAHGGDFGADPVLHFNGGLFADAEVEELTVAEIQHVSDANIHNWADVEPSIFGTLFERFLDPAKRSQIGAHYTSRDDIETLVKPVVMAPLRREWDDVKVKCEALWPKVQAAARKETKAPVTRPLRPGAPVPLPKAAKQTARGKFDKLLSDYVHRLSHVRILDPACGSGNFLYVAINLLLDLEKEVTTYLAIHGITQFPQVRPTQLAGIEINPYAQQLAQVAIWIGYLQWMHHNGYIPPRNPVLDPIESIRCMDAILDLTDPAHPTEPEWQETDFIVGNPPFLGNKRMRSELGDEYCTALRTLFADRIPAMSDLCCYWFEKAQNAIHRNRCKRAGLLATTGITQVGARRVLERIRESQPIFFAVSDRDWILDGASVRISIIGFGELNGGEVPELDGRRVAQINADLTSGADATTCRPLAGNKQICFMGTTKVGAFDIPQETAQELLLATSPHGRPNSDVIRPYRNGSDVARTLSHRWVIDFGVGTPLDQAALYEAPFEFLVRNVKPEREKNNDKWRASHWWLLGRTIPDFRAATRNLARYIATPRVAKHRLFVWFDSAILPDSKIIAIAFDGDFQLAALQSRVHEVWTRANCGWHGLGNDVTYNPTTCFETFAFPEPTDGQRELIIVASRELDQLRNRWLNPPEWTREEILEFPGSANGPWRRYVVNLDARGVGTVRYRQLVAKDDETAKQLAKRTLTNLYNERPTWLDLAHRKLDEAVFAGYGWPSDLTDDQILEKLLTLNLELASAGVTFR